MTFINEFLMGQGSQKTGLGNFLSRETSELQFLRHKINRFRQKTDYKLELWVKINKKYIQIEICDNF